MDYVIRNNRNVYIKLDANGMPVTCNENMKGIFEYSKAKNILNHLPKTMKNYHFKVDAIPEIKPKEIKEVIKKTPLKTQDYSPSENVTRWIDKFGMCGDVLSEAEEREKELLRALSDSDKELIDILHIIEIEKPKDLFGGWKLYKWIRKNRKERRDIKDELLIIEEVLAVFKNIGVLHRQKIRKQIDGLFSRKYSFKVVEEEGEINTNL